MRGESVNQHYPTTETYIQDVLTFMQRETIAHALRTVSHRMNAAVKSTPLERMPRRQLSTMAITILPDDGNNCNFHLDGVPVASHKRGARLILSHFFPDTVCCAGLKELTTRLVGQLIYTNQPGTSIVEVGASNRVSNSYDSICVRVSGSARNCLASAEAAFNFVHLLSHLTANAGGIFFWSAYVSLPSAQCHFNPVIHEILHEWCSSSSASCLVGHRIHVLKYAHEYSLEQDRIPSREEMQAVTKLFQLRQLSVYLQRENIPALLQLAVLEQEADTQNGGRFLLDYSSIFANRDDTFTDEDLCGVVKFFMHCETDAPWRRFATRRDAGIELWNLNVCVMSTQPQNKCPLVELACPLAPRRWHDSQLELGFFNSRVNRLFRVTAVCRAYSDEGKTIRSVRVKFT